MSSIFDPPVVGKLKYYYVEYRRGSLKIDSIWGANNKKHLLRLLRINRVVPDEYGLFRNGSREDVTLAVGIDIHRGRTGELLKREGAKARWQKNKKFKARFWYSGRNSTVSRKQFD